MFVSTVVSDGHFHEYEIRTIKNHRSDGDDPIQYSTAVMSLNLGQKLEMELCSQNYTLATEINFL